MDAIASDMAVLSGLQAANGPQYMGVIADKGEVSYGIAVSQGTSQLAQKIAEALEDMVEDGQGYVHKPNKAHGFAER